MEKDEFEDFASDEDFSDVDGGDEEAAWSEEESARVVGLMADARPAAVSAGSQGAAQATGSAREARRPEQSDNSVRTQSGLAFSEFDLFLAEFSRHQSSDRERHAQLEAETTPPDSQKQQPSLEQKTNIRTTPTDGDASRNSHVESADGTVTSLPRPDSPKWGVFLPERMPARREPTTIKSSVLKVEARKMHRVLVPGVAYCRYRVARLAAPTAQQPSFRPTINKAFFRRRGMARLRYQTKTHFTKRMEQDINEREARRQKRVAQKQQQDHASVFQHRQRRKSLVAKGSQEILERNGLWEEPFEVRLHRLLKAPSRQCASAETPIKPHRRILREKEFAKARACESLYRRGLDKIQRDRVKSLKIHQEPQEKQYSRRTESIVRERMERELQKICSLERNSEVNAKSISLPPTVSFVEFSCVLLYFGFVPDARATCEENPAVTLLWYAWTVCADGSGDQREMDTSKLKQLVESVMFDRPLTGGRNRVKPSRDPTAHLLDVFRLNYLARPHPHNASSRLCLPGSSGKSLSKNATFSHVVYSLHGKAVAPHPGECRNEDPLELRHAVRQRRMEQLRREKEEREVAECTFKPRISPRTCNELSLGNTADDVDSSSSEEIRTFDRLYSDAFVRQNNNISQYYSARQAEEEQRKKEMRISPTYVNGMTVDERLQRLHNSVSNNALPVHFYEKIAHMRRANELKIQEALNKQSRIEPIRIFPKTLDGRTIVAPFSFTSRHKKSPPRETAPSAAIQQQLEGTAGRIRQMKLVYDPKNPETSSRGEDGSDADLSIDVHVSPFETYELRLNCGDNIQSAVDVFARRHNLGIHQEMDLRQHAESKLKELFDF